MAPRAQPRAGERGQADGHRGQAHLAGYATDDRDGPSRPGARAALGRPGPARGGVEEPTARVELFAGELVGHGRSELGDGDGGARDRPGMARGHHRGAVRPRRPRLCHPHRRQRSLDQG